MKAYLWLIFAGLVFFSNPCFNLFDFLPDFIGCMLIMSGLSKLRLFDGNFSEARRNAKFLLWISVLKLLLCMWTHNGHSDYVMPFTFIFGVLEIIFMLGLFRNLYLACEYTFMRSGYEGKFKVLNEAFTMSFVFTIVIKAMDFIPHITDILAQDAELDLSHGASFKMPMYTYKIYLTFFCLVCGLILGAVYLYYTARAWIKLARSNEYNSFLREKFTDYTITERDKYIGGKIEKIYFLLTFGCVFIIDFCIDSVNILPTAIGIILVFWASVNASLMCSKRPPVVLFLLTLVSSVADLLYMTQVRMGISFISSAMTYNKQEFSLLSSQKSIAIGSVLSVISFALFTALIFVCISRMKLIFREEKRTVALPMLNFAKALTVVAGVSSCFGKIATCVMGYMATKPEIEEYIFAVERMPESISNELYMNSTFIQTYETINTLGYVFVILSVAVTLVSVLYLLRIRRFTDGEV